MSGQRTIGVPTIYGPDRVDVLWQRGGLAVHRCLGPWVGFNVTHVASGHVVRVPSLDSQASAIRLARELLAIGDWTRDRTTLTADAEHIARLREVLKRWEYEL